MRLHSIFDLFLQSIALGIFATFIMDFCNVLGKRLKIHQGGSYILIGRWIRGFFYGQFRYANITQVPSQPNEALVGIVSHYCIGIFLALIYLYSAQLLSLNTESLGWAIGYGTLTNILPWFVMFPAFGFGIMALKGPPKNQFLRTSFLNHLGYGIALGFGEILWLKL